MPTGDPLYDSLISGYTSTMDQQPDETTLLNTILQRYMDPQQQERLKQLRETTPEQINRANMQEYYGKGKLGTVMQILTGIVGTPQPNWHKLATERWNQNQALAQQQETNANTLAKSELQGVLAGRKNAADAMKAALGARSKEQIAQWQIASREKLSSNLEQLKRDIEQGRMSQEQARLQWKQYVDEENLKLNKLRTVFGGDIGSELGKIIASGDPELMKTMPIVVGGKQAEMEARSARPETPGIARQFQTNRVDPTTGLVVPTTGTSVTPGKPAIGNRNAISDWFRDIQQGKAPTNALGQPIVSKPETEAPELDSNLSPRDQKKVAQGMTEVLKQRGSSPVLGSMQYSQAGNPRIGSASKPPAPLPEGGVAFEIPIPDTIQGQARVKAYYRPPNGTQAFKLPPDKLTSAEREARTKMTQTTNSVSKVLENAFIEGKLDDRFSMGKLIAERIKAGAPSDWVRISGTGDQSLEVQLNVMTEQVANYLKQMSGAQVADAEFQRLRKIFPDWASNPEMLVKQAYSRMMFFNAARYMDSIHATPAPEFWQALTDLVEEQTNDYYGFLDGVKRTGGAASLEKIATSQRAKELGIGSLDDMKSAERIVIRALQSTYKGASGKYVRMPYDNPAVPGSMVDVYIPPSWKGTNTPDGGIRDLKKILDEKKRKDAQRRNILLDPDMIKAQKALPRF